MRIAFLVSEFPSVSQTFILNQITGLIDRGHDIDIYAQHESGLSTIHADIKRYKLLNHTYYTPTIPKNKLLRVLKGFFLLLTNLHKRPIVILRSLNFFKHGKEAANFNLLYKSIPFLRKKCNYDIIHCHFGLNGLLGTRLLELGAIHGKLVTTFHGFDISSYIKNQDDKVYTALFEKGDLFMSISERWKKRLIELGCNEHKILVHHCGVECNKLAFNKSNFEKNKKVNILTIARLVEKKGVEYGIRAVAKLRKKFQNVQYNIVGDGPLREHCSYLIEESGLGETIHLLGSKSKDEVYKLIGISDILLCPSVTSADGDQEGIPVVLMEAMSANLPVISTQHSGIPELVQDGIYGFLVPERDIDALADKLTYLIEHPEIWPDMGRAGRAYVEANYDIDKLNNRLVDIYKELLETGRVSSGE